MINRLGETFSKALAGIFFFLYSFLFEKTKPLKIDAIANVNWNTIHKKLLRHDITVSENLVKNRRKSHL